MREKKSLFQKSNLTTNTVMLGSQELILGFILEIKRHPKLSTQTYGFRQVFIGSMYRKKLGENEVKPKVSILS